MSRINRPRYDVHGKVTATFWPRGCTRYNCMIGALVCRKQRGGRRRGRAYQAALRAYRRRLTPEEVDGLVRATTAKMVLIRGPIAIDRRSTPFMGMFQGIPLYAEEFDNELQ